ncbi:Y-family DNA polymerase [Alphaproteobacteria bacterium]|nr:Y-family DNA polymerase [Alphaproteobacteria bacterium]
MQYLVLVDCNSFYASCESIFNPYLADKPVVVLSNNDGCVIARSSQAKKVGIKMGVPYFQIKELVKKNKVHVYSSNYTLYGDISSRVMSVLKELSDDLEIYSIDEAFLIFNKSSQRSFYSRALNIKNIINKWIGVPVSVGIAPNKTLCKVANFLAKKDEMGSQVVSLTNTREIELALKILDVNEIWGVGARISEFLKSNHIHTAYDLYKQDPRWIRQHLGVTGERTYRELKGERCLNLNEKNSIRNQCIVSRSFENYIINKNDLEKRIVSYATRASEKIRNEKLQVKNISVFIRSNKFSKNQKQYNYFKTLSFINPTNHIFDIVKKSLEALNSIFQEGIQYKKAGVILSDLYLENSYNEDLFNRECKARSEKLNKLDKVFDSINKRYGGSSISLARENHERFYITKRRNLSPSYTTNFNELPIAN